MSVELQRRRFTVRDYYAMADAGILTEDDRVELIEGEIVEMAAIGSRHASCVGRLTRLFASVGDNAFVWVQNPVRLSDLTEPQPDVALLRPRPDFYAEGHPLPEDVLLVVEVAHSTLGYDRGVKLPLYAAAGVAEVWIVNLDEDLVEVHSDPAGSRYRAGAKARRGDVVRPTLVPAVELSAVDVLG
jgi:Uma2 family endonuclease